MTNDELAQLIYKAAKNSTEIGVQELPSGGLEIIIGWRSFSADDFIPMLRSFLELGHAGYIGEGALASLVNLGTKESVFSRQTHDAGELYSRSFVPVYVFQPVVIKANVPEERFDPKLLEDISKVLLDVTTEGCYSVQDVKKIARIFRERGGK